MFPVDDYSKMTKKELVKFLTQLEVDFLPEMEKARLIELLYQKIIEDHTDEDIKETEVNVVLQFGPEQNVHLSSHEDNLKDVVEMAKHLADYVLEKLNKQMAVDNKHYG